MIGTVLNSRYEVTELLGEGGMALVFQARDLLLDRWVALKVLRPQLVSDRDFIHRFHREAKAVASLSHPNIVNIYDIGQDKDIHYLVMESIEGENLNEMIKREGIIQPRDAFDIAIQICEALVVAHRNNIIHCDIKPHNILITKDNRVKVTDFGIARAVNSATMAQTETVIGTAHYFSPEQARGETIHAQSDLYSLGVVLYEMLTGKVPFRGDSPITVALKHINEEPVPPSNVNESLPKRVDKIVIKALNKDPNRRFSDASEMLRTLEGMSRTLEKTAETPAPITKPYSANDETQVLPRIRDTRKTNEGDAVVEEDVISEKTFIIKLLKPLGITFGAMILLGFLFLWGLSKYTDVPEIKVPNFVGLNVTEAKTKARQVGVKVNVNSFKVASDIPADHVAVQDIEVGRTVKKGREILLTLSRGATMTKVPSLIGKEMREVTVALDQAGLVIGEVEEEFSVQIPKGVVMTQEPIVDTEVKAGEKVNLTFSKGPEPKIGTIPPLVGLSRAEAEQRITQGNFIVGSIIEEETTRYLANIVARQDPAPGTSISEQTPVNLVLSKGIMNPKNLPVYELQAFYYIPPGPYNQRIQIFVEDDNGREEIYNRVHHPEERITIKNINAVGPSILEIFNNGQKIQSETYGF